MYNNITDENDFEIEEMECDCGEDDCLICNPLPDDCDDCDCDTGG
jgi:hypothetical protein